MGMSVSVYTNIKKSTEDTGDFYAYVDAEQWLDRIKNLEEYAWYTGDYHDDLYFGHSCSDHTWFRNKLSSLVLDREVDDFTEIIDDNLDMAFIELINFSDCEGTMDWETCEKLFRDFVDWEERMQEEFPIENSPNMIENRMFRTRYYLWMNAFAVAKNNGVLEIH